LQQINELTHKEDSLKISPLLLYNTAYFTFHLTDGTLNNLLCFLVLNSSISTHQVLSRWSTCKGTDRTQVI